ncbi:MAG: hypothetical protein RIQ60_685 [Pseudomonadota bacterium]|jgi:hypothetical protein
MSPHATITATASVNACASVRAAALSRAHHRAGACA